MIRLNQQLNNDYNKKLNDQKQEYIFHFLLSLIKIKLMFLCY